ncbi:4-hydroxy-tetrahydrodipicolinate synthase [Heliobacterium undosum]|uniref:4-hydroxy-tetrahydrodipicolinate synthase n=1 Tax=Heliomicrobium undosum TaxID=121734 RepID=A0A845L0S3_9FIRM|nr:4-hydroxy-tetrahydrodipicolinate synthase [Heliomicrobium undosum]MZP30067.1 4-hydroxy-tetrahydrodipicolinate synthase [Heliomicrobium undosum]
MIPVELRGVVRGVIPAVLTPLKDNQSIDFHRLGEYVDWLIKKGVHGLFPMGTNGEGVLFSTDERKEAAETVVGAAGARVPVIIHTGAASTGETIALTRHAKRVGASAAAVVAPFFLPHDDAALEAHFVAVAEAVPDFPIFLYNIPANAGNDIKPKVAAAVARRCANVVGIKDSSKDLGRLQEYIATLGEDFTVVVGSDALIYPALLVGAAGVVSAVANVFPEAAVAIYEAVRTGDYEEGLRRQNELNRLRKALKIGPFITPYKKALERLGFSIGGPRAPLREMTADEEQAMEKALQALNLLP